MLIIQTTVFIYGQGGPKPVLPTYYIFQRDDGVL